MACNCDNIQTLALDTHPWVGTVLKFLVNPTATGFDASTDNWEVEVRYGSYNKVYKVFKKTDMIEKPDGYVIVIDTEGMNGLVRAIVYAYVPDADCGVTRKEVEVVDLCIINSL